MRSCLGHVPAAATCACAPDEVQWPYHTRRTWYSGHTTETATCRRLRLRPAGSGSSAEPEWRRGRRRMWCAATLEPPTRRGIWRVAIYQFDCDGYIALCISTNLVHQSRLCEHVWVQDTSKVDASEKRYTRRVRVADARDRVRGACGVRRVSTVLVRCRAKRLEKRASTAICTVKPCGVHACTCTVTLGSPVVMSHNGPCPCDG